MDTFEFNKIAGAILGSLLFVMAIGFLAEVLYAPRVLEHQAYVVEVDESAGGQAEAAAPEPEIPLASLLAKGDADKGARDAKKCAACHNFEAGQPNKVGPNLHGVVGRPMGSIEGFAYSDAMRERASGGNTWTYENLFDFTRAPKDWLPGTKMAFAGLKKPEDRADVIAFLRSISPDAPPLPEPEQSAAAGEAASGDTGAAGGGAGDQPAGGGASDQPAVGGAGDQPAGGGAGDQPAGSDTGGQPAGGEAPAGQ